MGLDTDLPRLVEERNVAGGVHCFLYKTTENPTLAIHGSIRAGTGFEPDDKPGLAELTARLLIRGSAKKGSAKIADLLESVGAAISFRNTPDNIVFQARTTSPWTRRVLGILTDCLTRPAFNLRDVEKEKEGLLSDIRLREDDTTRRGLRELQQLVYPPAHPYRRDRLGTTDSVKKLAKPDVADYFENVVSRAEVVVAFAGSFEKEKAVDWAGRTFGDREENRNAPDEKSSSSVVPAVRKDVLMAHKMQADVLIGAPAIARTGSDYEPINLLNVILGELGFMGRLGQRVRDKEGLAYSCTSFLNVGALGGSWTAVAGVNPKNLVRAEELIREEIGRVCKEPVTDDELNMAKENQTGSAVMELESTEGIARTSHNLAYLRLGLDYFAKRRELYRKVSTGDLLEMAQKYLDPSRLSTIIIGPRVKTASSKS